MDIEAKMTEVKAAEERIRKDREIISRIKQEIAEYMCPFEVGEMVLNSKGGEEMIACISPYFTYPWYEFKIFKIKRNGEPYSQSQYAYNRDKYTKLIDKDNPCNATEAEKQETIQPKARA